MKRNFWIFVITLHALAFLWQIKTHHLYLTDSYEYLWASENINKGILNCADPNKPHFSHPDFLTKRPPVYPIIIWTLKSIIYSNFWLIFCQNLLSIINIYILVSWIQASQKKVNYGLLSILVLLSPAQMIYANMVMSEIWLQFFLISASFLAWKFIQKPESNYFILTQLLFCLAFLTKPVMYLFIFPLFIFSCFFIIKYKTWKLWAWALIPLFVCFSYCQWNAYRTGYFHFSSIQKINLLTYNTWHFLISKMPENKVDSLITNIQLQCKQEKTYAEQCACENQASFQLLFSSENRIAYALAHVKGMFQLFLDPGRFDLYNFAGLSTAQPNGLLHEFHQSGLPGVVSFLSKQPLLIVFYILLLFIGNVCKLLIFILLPFFSRDKSMLLPYLLLIYVAVLTGPIGASRFMTPFLPVYFWLIHLFFTGRKTFQTKS